MNPKLRPREVFSLYGLTLLTLTSFFLLGLYLGQSLFVEAEPKNLAKLSISNGSDSEKRPELEFYEGLTVPTRREANQTQNGSSLVIAEENSSVTVVAPTVESHSDDPRFTVQIAALVQVGEAQQLLIRLQARGYEAVIARLGQKDQYYRVWVGDFSSEVGASRTE